METYWKKSMRKIKQHTAKKSSKTKQKKSLRKKMKNKEKYVKILDGIDVRMKR